MSITVYCDVIENRIRDLLACSIVPQTSCLSHRPIRLFFIDQTVNSELYTSILCSSVMTLRVAAGLPINTESFTWDFWYVFSLIGITGGHAYRLTPPPQSNSSDINPREFCLWGFVKGTLITKKYISIPDEGQQHVSCRMFAVINL